jgi:hypothetical protein
MKTLGKITLLLDDILSQVAMDNIHENLTYYLVIESSH